MTRANPVGLKAGPSQGWLVSRRGTLLAVAGLFGGRAGWAISPRLDAPARLAELERREGGRLGVAVLDTQSGQHFQHRGGERFALCSTFKFLAAAAILERVDRGQEKLDRWIPFGQKELLDYSPMCKEHVGEGGMKLSELCAAAVEWSDNTAANLILSVLGGPSAVTQYCRSLGDSVTRLDHIEPALNVVQPGEVHDTTTPTAMVGLLSVVFHGDALCAPSRKQLEDWMLGSKVGLQRLRAGLPEGWKIGHKTGTYASYTNDVGIVWPPDSGPIFIAAYYSRSGAPHEQPERVLASVGRIVAEVL